MARLIFISPYLKGGEDKAQLINRTNYIATRKGVELLQSEHRDEPASQKQREYISRLLKTFPQAKELAEYEDYRSAPTKDTASEFIDQANEQFVTSMDERENFLDYVSHRPGVRSDGDHGLWDKDGKVQNLSKAVEEVANHPGIVWTPVVSLRREDAERLGYTDVDNWRALVNACSQEIAEGYKIAPENLRWYAALHEKEKHIHIHMVVFSVNPKEGYLTKEGIRDIKSAFATRVFEQDLLHTYERETEYRNALGKSAQARMSELVTSMNSGTGVSERLEQLIGELAEKLKTTNGKKVYGYLPPRVKSVVDEIVDELAKDERVAAAYSLWQDMQDEVVRTYTDELPERIPLSQQKEFKPVRNMVIRETLKLAEGAVTFDDEGMDEGVDDEGVYDQDTDDAPEEGAEEEVEEEATETLPPPAFGTHKFYELLGRYRQAKEVLYNEDADIDEKLPAIEMLEHLWKEGFTLAAHQLGKVYRDGLGVDADTEKAIEWFRKAAERGELCSAHALGKLLLSTDTPDDGVRWLKYAAGKAYHYSQYTLGKLYLKGEHVSQDVDKGLEYLRASAGQDNQFAQYTLGKLYLKGEFVSQDVDTALKYLSASAEQRNQFAQYTLGKLYLKGEYVKKDVGVALGYLMASSGQKNQFAQYTLGKLYLKGEYVKKNVGLALEYLKAAAEQENQFAQYALGRMYLSGEYVSRDVETALEYLKASAEQKNPCAQYTLGKLYLGGEYVKKDVDTGLEYLKASVEQENSFAQYALGKLYLKGEYVKKDVGIALEYLKASAEQENQFAQYTLGKVYLSGEYVSKDVDTALKYLKASAGQKNQFAQYTLGKLYLSGEYVSKDIDTALEYLKASAEQGNQYAQYTLGKLYLLGREVPPDREAAVVYLTQSAAQGNPYAQFFLDHLNDMYNSSVGLAVLRMFHHMANIFRDSTAQDSIHMGLHIDRKRRRELQEKRIAMGHKPDDHEDENMNQTMR